MACIAEAQGAPKYLHSRLLHCHAPCHQLAAFYTVAGMAFVLAAV